MNIRPGIVPLGDSALLVQFGDGIDTEINQLVHALDARLRSENGPGNFETVPAYSTLLVQYDPLDLTYANALDWVNSELDQISIAAPRPGRQVEVPVRYGGEDGPDLEFVASYHHLDPREIVRIHTSLDYLVFMMGFTPGFPYMGKLDAAIQTPRMETPRKHVAAGSVGIAGLQTGIYPIDSPGGWRILGRTSLCLFDLALASPFLFSPGDRVRFVMESIHV